MEPQAKGAIRLGGAHPASLKGRNVPADGKCLPGLMLPDVQFGWVEALKATKLATKRSGKNAEPREFYECSADFGAHAPPA